MASKHFFSTALVFALVSTVALSAPPVAGGDAGEDPQFSTALSVPATAEGAPGCALNEELAASAPQMAAYLRQVCEGLAKTIDYRTGKGTGQVLRDLDRYADELANKAGTLTLQDFEAIGFDYDMLRRFVAQTTGGKGMQIPVMAYSDYVKSGNKIFDDSGFGFLRYQQHPVAELLEAYWNIVAWVPRIKGVTQEDIKRLSDKAYPGLPAHIIKLPLHTEELRQFAHLQRFSRFELIGDDSVKKASDIPLGKMEDPMKGEAFWYRKLQACRLGLTVGVITAGGIASGGLSVPAFAGIGLASGLEAQFTYGSKFWAKVWDRGGIPANVAVNGLYAAIMASGEFLAQWSVDAPITFEWETFAIRTFVMTVTQVGAVGGLQVITARMREEGQMSEGWRLLIETVGATVANFGRSMAIVAGMFGAEYTVFQLRGAHFGLNEAIGWSLQAAIFATISAPFLIKRIWGDKAITDLIAYKLIYKDDPSHAWNRGLLGTLRYGCANAVAWLAGKYSPVRTSLSRD